MAMSSATLAEEITTGMGFPLPPSTELEGFATSIINELTQNGVAGFNGSPGPWSITGLSASSLANRIKSNGGYPSVSGELTDFCSGTVDHIQSSGQVFYTGPGTTGDSTHYFTGGTISGLDGNTMASLIASNFGKSTTQELIDMCTAITQHIMSNAEVESGVIS